jgi:8-amino-7-oxononanoate synthase
MANRAASNFLVRLEGELNSLASQSQLRRLAVMPSVNFCSNDYLGLSTDIRLRNAVADAMASGVAVGSTGSRLLSGNARIWEDLEAELARFAGAESALYFNSGYAANTGLFGCIAGPADIIFSDRANHASIIDGIRLSGARKAIFPHLDLDFLERELRRCDGDGDSGQKFIAVESVFSMDGDRAPLAELASLASRYGAELIVDEAHATGVFGPEGRGLMACSGAKQAVLATVHPCGKAFAGMGAFICCSETLKRYLINRARTFIFSTALPPYLAFQMRAAAGIVAAAEGARSHLASLGEFLRARLRAAGFDTGGSSTQIVPVLLGANERSLQFANLLCEAGFAVRAIRPPTVPAGTSRLRLSLTAGMSIEILEGLVSEMVRIREQAVPSVCGAGCDGDYDGAGDGAARSSAARER